MSKRETPITRCNLEQLGGLLVEEFCLVDQTATCGGRWVDALVLPQRETRIATRAEQVDIAPGEANVFLDRRRRADLECI